MDTATLSKLCRCSHARRDHNTGTLGEWYRTNCWICSCHYFELTEEWEQQFASELRNAGFIVQRVSRDGTGRFQKEK